VQVVRYQRADRERVFALLRDVYPPSDAARLMRQWDWKYEDNPFNPDREPYILLLQEHHQLVGMYGRLFFPAVIDGSLHLIHHGCDLVVHPAYRGRGLSAQLRDRDLIESAIHFSWQNEASYQAARRDGTAGVPYRALVRPLDVGVMLRHVVGDHWFTRTASGLINGALQRLPPVRRHSGDPEVAVTRIACFDDRFYRLWQRCSDGYRAMIVRDQGYLEWRFSQRPGAEYYIAAATRGSDLVGYMVTRYADRNGERRGYLVDFLVEKSEAPVFAALVAHAVDYLRQQRASLAICRLAVPPYRSMLYRHGFLPWPGAPRGYLRVRMPPQSSPSATDARQWFLTMGDGDLEMSF
jgi:GNAT superfamily N-acetyltransferase